MQTAWIVVSWLWLWALGSGLAAQGSGSSQLVQGATAAVAGWLADCTRGLSAPGRSDAEATAHAALGHLRLGQLDAARARLGDLRHAAQAGGPPIAACWAAVAHQWYLRASRDVDEVRRHLPSLRAAVELAADTAVSAPTFAEAALLPHALFCLGSIADACGDGARAGTACTHRAVALWLDLERETWQPGRGHFRPRPTRGEIRLPEPPDASVLAPAAAGMLIASGDRLSRHLRTTLPIVLGQSDGGLRAAAWTLCGAVQLGDHDHVQAAWQALLAADRTSLAAAPGEAGRALDATLFALTGLRLATGAGVDEGATRFRPWLPPGSGRLLLRDVLADGARFDLTIAERAGPWQDDESDEAALGAARQDHRQDLGAPRRLRVQLTLTGAVDTGPRTIVLQGLAVQYVARLRIGEQLERSLPLDPR